LGRALGRAEAHLSVQLERRTREKRKMMPFHIFLGLEKKNKKTWWSINPRYQINGSRSFSLVTFIT
jgi:hypothetical protein